MKSAGNIVAASFAYGVLLWDINNNDPRIIPISEANGITSLNLDARFFPLFNFYFILFYFNNNYLNFLFSGRYLAIGQGTIGADSSDPSILIHDLVLVFYVYYLLKHFNNVL